MTPSPGSRHPKQDFQVERLAFFSDAVFAIAITLLIIEFKVPHVSKDSTYVQVIDELKDLKYNLVALLLSFVLIAIYWTRHHFLFKHIHDYNRLLVIVNLFVLLPVIFFPFTTAFFAESIQNKSIVFLAFRLFLLNHIVAGLSTFVLYWLAIVRHREISFEMPVKSRIKFTSDTLWTTAIFMFILAVTYFTTDLQTLFGVIIICILLKRISERWFYNFVSKKQVAKAS